jgi:hypothetical protein
VPAVGWSIHDDQEYEMVGEDELPDFPTPVVVSDKRGRAKWTVSIPPSYEFPLEPKIYEEICRQNMEASNHVADLRRHKHLTHQAHYDYYHIDPYFMDVAEAEKHGMLPNPSSRASSSTWDSMRNNIDGSIIGENKDGLIDKEICEKSMTFIMESSDAGLGQTLMLLWMAYGLAQKEERAFFIDDSRWYVKIFSDYGIILTLLGRTASTPASSSRRPFPIVDHLLAMKCSRARIMHATLWSQLQPVAGHSAAHLTSTLKTLGKWRSFAKSLSSSSLTPDTKLYLTLLSPTHLMFKVAEWS